MNNEDLINQQLSEQLGREVYVNELVPTDYFDRLEMGEIFSRSAPIEIDLGCGDGSFLIQLAEHYPDRNFIGVERLMGRVKKVCKKALRAKLENVKVLRLETLYTTEWLLPKSEIDRVHMICPDPWPKEKHHKNRVMQRPFLEAVESILKLGGEFLFRTDHPEYYEWAQHEVNEFGRFEVIPWDEHDFFYPKSDFQLQWEAEGTQLQNIRCRKITS